MCEGGTALAKSPDPQPESSLQHDNRPAPRGTGSGKRAPISMFDLQDIHWFVCSPTSVLNRIRKMMCSVNFDGQMR